MSLENRYLYRVYCSELDQFTTTVSSTEPVVCPIDDSAIDSDQTLILDSRFIDINTDGYLNLESELADNRALVIQASDTNGGIDIDAGIGGITIDSTNAISIDAGAESNFTTSAGNLIIQATTGLCNIDGGSGMNIGNDASTTPILIGTSSNEKVINIGNQTGATDINVNTGTAGFRVDSANGQIYLASSQASGGSISLDAGSGGLTFTSGVFGTALNSSGLIGINHWSGGDILFGTSAVVRTITVANQESGTRLILYSGDDMIITSQPTHVVLADADTTLLIADMLTGIIVTNNTGVSRQWTLPTAVNVVASLTVVNMAFTFSIINEGSQAITLVTNTGVTYIGSTSIPANASVTFKCRATNVTASSEAYTLYRCT